MEKFKFELEFEESLMQSTINKAFKKFYPSSVLRKATEERKINEQVRKFLSDQSLLGMLNPVKQRDVNLMLCTILVSEAGRRLLSFPLIEQLMALYVLKETTADSKDIDDLESGEKIATIGWKEDLDFKVDHENQYVDGVIKSIPFADESDQILVPIKKKREDETDQVLIIKTDSFKSKLRNTKTQDLTYPLFELNLKGTKIDGDSIRLIKLDLHDFYRVADLLIAAELLGISEETLEMTLNYTKERKQFGVEIGKFQALKHMLADMHLLCESSKVSIEYGAWTVENEGEDHEIISTISKAYSSDAAIRIVENSIQIHGAVGFTWEHDLHFYLKRAYRLANMCKTPYEEREKVASYLIDGKTAIISGNVEKVYS
ncbi:acyl-CoA dehydrogenase family protein [Paenisporosarcina sp. TG-14]|uniref:acyl-CoA dehydrogenase family protein n=1 Tax=Paenisporosarcina sp. TG-14 TaxID=1231057 RepID=UPI0002E10FC3|nr:acyl-CoA dehydrogenase family protein [Paenisporosarcina sp. TG-14]